MFSVFSVGLYFYSFYIRFRQRSNNNRPKCFLLDVVLLGSGVEGYLGKKLVLIRHNAPLLLLLKAESNCKTTGIVFHFYLSQK